MASTFTRKMIKDLKPNDSFIIFENSSTGVVLRSDIVDGNSIDTASQLSGAQLVSLTLNEAARKYGVGKFFWIPSREERMLANESGLCFNGGDLVYIPWVWSDIDNHLYDDATPYERLRLTNAWTCLPGKTIVLSIFNDYKVKPTDPTYLPSTTNYSEHPPLKFDFFSASVLLLWDDFPNLAFKEQFAGIDLTATRPIVTAENRRQRRLEKCKAVVAKVHEFWNTKTEKGKYRRVSMEEVYADALFPGEEKEKTLEKITWKSDRA